MRVCAISSWASDCLACRNQASSSLSQAGSPRGTAIAVWCRRRSYPLRRRTQCGNAGDDQVAIALAIRVGTCFEIGSEWDDLHRLRPTSEWLVIQLGIGKIIRTPL